MVADDNEQRMPFTKTYDRFGYSVHVRAHVFTNLISLLCLPTLRSSHHHSCDRVKLVLPYAHPRDATCRRCRRTDDGQTPATPHLIQLAFHHVRAGLLHQKFLGNVGCLPNLSCYIVGPLSTRVTTTDDSFEVGRRSRPPNIPRWAVQLLAPILSTEDQQPPR